MTRQGLLSRLSIGLRTFYRELELLKKCGIRLVLEVEGYRLKTTAGEAEGRLPFPDPQLSFAEMAELASKSGPAAKRLSELLASVVKAEIGPAPRKKKSRPAK
jgi:predicted DNA-binding transcriptional regulator YafY